MEKTRNITFDIAKGIGIILVVLGHYTPEEAPAWYIGFVDFIYCFHMPLFFIIAGFFFDRSTSDKSYLSLVKSKFKRLIVPYFILSWVVIGIKILFDSVLHVEHPVAIEALYRVFYLPEAGYYLWFVYVLFLIFCIAPFFKPGNRLTVLSFVALGIAFWQSAPEICCIGQLCRHLIFFVFGMWVSRIKSLEKAMYGYAPLWAGATILLFFLYPVDFPQSVLRWVIGGITGSFMIISFSQLIRRASASMTRALSYIGNMSMTIYLFHTLFMGGVKAILTYIISGGDIIEFIVSALFIIGTGIVCPVCLYKWVWAKGKFTSRIFK